jgi:cellulose synthase/poly-beta-1,6-N-acetylglucosamine synthase-like glycosyltransferase
MEYLFWLSVFLVFHTYVLYPLILRFTAYFCKPNQKIYLKNENLPSVSIIMSVYNEEKVLAQKIDSILSSDYQKEQIEICIGSDNSSDGTNSILKEYAGRSSSLVPSYFDIRQGKANIINQLAISAKGEILVLTDANVYFTKDTIYNLAKHFKNPEIDIAGGNIVNTNIKKDGISFQEKTYLVNENTMKYHEGIIWGSMMGAFGGCYAIRKNKYAPVPKNYFMDDFYITMHVLSSGGKAINELDAICYEDVSNIIYEEFRRKIRISIGNFQNLSSFKKLLWPPYKGIGFSFLSHKVLRWFTPVFIIFALVSSIFLMNKSVFYQFLFFTQCLLMFCPVIDTLLKKINFHNSILRFITHFYLMNLTLLAGLFLYLRGPSSNIWQPTKRYQ